MQILTMPAIPERPVMSVRYTGNNVEEVKAFCEAKRIFVADDIDKTLFDAAKCKPFQNSILRGKDAWANHLKKYRFKTKSIDDYRPLRDMKDIQMLWWCTSINEEFATIICYLPVSANLATYWDDAYEIEISDAVEIEYSERFPKPEWVN